MNGVLVRPSTSWMSVLGGWIATIGAMALVAPAVAGVLGGANIQDNDIAPAVPVVIGIFISYLIGGYVAGRMAGYRTSWHGMLTAFFSLFVLLVVVLLTYAADRGAFAGIGVNNLTDLVPGAAGLNVETFGTGKVADETIRKLIEEHFDFRPGAIIERFGLRRPIYRQTAAYGHFGRPDLPWEMTDLAEKFAKAAGAKAALA